MFYYHNFAISLLKENKESLFIRSLSVQLDKVRSILRAKTNGFGFYGAISLRPNCTVVEMSFQRQPMFLNLLILHKALQSFRFRQFQIVFNETDSVTERSIHVEMKWV